MRGIRRGNYSLITIHRFSEDIDDQNSGNYDYDAIGQLTKDASEHIEKIEWNVYGKISRIMFNNGKPTMEFRYDAKGDRIAKLLTNALQPAETDTVYTATYYWRDAQGNILTTESRKFYDLPGVDPPIAATVTHPVEVEYNLYGSSRLGTFQDTLRYDISTPGVYGMYERWMAKRQYELSNHLGNVSATISDVKTYNTSNSDYEATVLSAQHYYPFGMQMPGKVYNLDHYSSLKKYRFGFNGKEKDDEVKGAGNSLDFGARIYDPRIGKWLSVDPLVAKYPSFSPYESFTDNPIIYTDPDGRKVTFFAGLNDNEKSQIQNSIARLTKSSQILSEIYSYMQSAREEYNIGGDNGAAENSGNFATYEKEDNPIRQWLGIGAQYSAAITMKKAGYNVFDSKNIMDVSLSEELFHAGQDLYYQHYRSKEKRSSLETETEARVFRAYSGFTFNETIDISSIKEPEVDEFMGNKDVQLYFNALRQNNTEDIKKYETAFRKQVVNLAKKISGEHGSYFKLNKEFNKYKKEGGSTPFFDAVTKESGMKN